MDCGISGSHLPGFFFIPFHFSLWIVLTRPGIKSPRAITVSLPNTTPGSIGERGLLPPLLILNTDQPKIPGKQESHIVCAPISPRCPIVNGAPRDAVPAAKVNLFQSCSFKDRPQIRLPLREGVDLNSSGIARSL